MRVRTEGSAERPRRPRRLTSLRALACATVLTAAVLGGARCANAADVPVIGKIVDRDSGRPIAGASVEALPENGAPAFARMRTRRDGAYSAALSGRAQVLLVVNCPHAIYAAFHGIVDTSLGNIGRVIALSKLSADEHKWLARVNRDREAHHVAPVAMDEAALLAARDHAAEMERYGYLRHVDRRGKEPWERYFGFFGIGQDYENIAVANGANWSDIESAFLAEGPAARDGLATHSTNLLNPKVKWAGLAIVNGATADYYDQELIAYP